MAQRIETLFATDKARVGFLTAGDGGMEHSFAAAMALIDGGINMLEIGVPFSDPIADGPVIQRSAIRALQSGTTLASILHLVSRIRQHSDIPLILFSYFNPILTACASGFIKKAKRAGIDGLLIVDCPFEEMNNLQHECIKNQIAPIYVITPTTTIARIKQINQRAQGFLYYACRPGTTGVRSVLPNDLIEKINFIKSISQLPVVVGFGIANANMVKKVLTCADGVVVGSRFIQAIEEGILPQELKMLTQNIFGTAEEV